MNNLLLERTNFVSSFEKSAKKIAECILDKRPYRIYVEKFFNSLLEFRNLDILSEALNHPDKPDAPPPQEKITPKNPVPIKPEAKYDSKSFIDNEKQKLKNVLNSTMIKMNSVLEKQIGTKKHSISVNYMALIKKLGQNYFDKISGYLKDPKNIAAIEKSQPRTIGKSSILHDPAKITAIKDWEKILVSQKIKDHPKIVDDFKALLLNYQLSGRIPNHVVHNWLKKNKINLDRLMQDAEKTSGSALWECILLSAKYKISPVLIVDHIEKNVIDAGFDFDDACENTKEFYLKEVRKRPEPKKLDGLMTEMTDEELEDFLNRQITDEEPIEIVPPDDDAWILDAKDAIIDKDDEKANSPLKHFGSNKKVFQDNLKKIIAQFDTAIQNSNLMYSIKKSASNIGEKIISDLTKKIENNTFEKMFKKDKTLNNHDVLFNRLTSRFGFTPDDFSPENLQNTVDKFDSIFKQKFTQSQRDYFESFVKDLNFIRVELAKDPDADLKDGKNIKVSGWSKFRNYISDNRQLVVFVGLAALILANVYGLSLYGKTNIAKAAIEEVQSTDESPPDNNLNSGPDNPDIDKKTVDDAPKKIDPKEKAIDPKEKAKAAAMGKLKPPVAPWPFPKDKEKSEPKEEPKEEPKVEPAKPQLPIEDLVNSKAYWGKPGYLGQKNLVAYKGPDGMAWVKSVDNLGRTTDKLGKMLYNNELKEKVNRAKKIGINFNPEKYSFEVIDGQGNKSYEHAVDFNIRAKEAEFEKLNIKPEPKTTYQDPFELSPKRNYDMGNKPKNVISGDSHGDPAQFLKDNPGKGAELVNNNFDNIDAVTSYSLASSPNSLDYNGFQKLSKNGNNSTLTNALIKAQMDIIKGGHTVTPYNLKKAAEQHNNTSSSSAAEPQQTSQAAAPQQQTSQPEVKQDSAPQEKQTSTNNQTVTDDIAATVQKKLDSGEDATSIIKGLEKIDNKTAKILLNSGKIKNVDDINNLLLNGDLDADLQVDASLQAEKMGGQSTGSPLVLVKSVPKGVYNSLKSGKTPYDIIAKYGEFKHKNIKNNELFFQYLMGYSKPFYTDDLSNLSEKEKLSNLSKRIAADTVVGYYGGIDNLSELQDNVFTSLVAGLALNQAISQKEAKVLMKNSNKILDDNVKKQLEKIANGEVRPFNEHRSFRSFLESKI